METPLQSAMRLITALEDMVMQETMLIRTMDFVEAVTMQERTAPLVEKLCQLATEPEVAQLQPRVGVLVDRCAQNYHFLESQLSRLQGELDRISDARSRLRSVAPIYRVEVTACAPLLNTAA